MDTDEQSVDERIAAIEAEREALFAQRAPIDARLKDLYQQLEQAQEEKARSLAITGPESLREMFDLGWSNGRGNRAASEALEAHAESLGITRDVGGGWRQTEGGNAYRAVGICLSRNQETAELAASYEEYARQAAAAAGVDVVEFSVMDSALSENGAYSVEVTPATGRAVLVRMRHHGRDELMEGTVAEVVDHVASNFWHDDPHDAGDDDRGWLDD